MLRNTPCRPSQVNRPTSTRTASPRRTARPRSRSSSTPRSWAKWFSVPPGSTARGRPCSSATSAAAFTVPSPPHTPSTRARAAALRNSVRVSAGSHSTSSARGRMPSRACTRSELPDPLLATTTRPSPSSSAGTSVRGRAGGTSRSRVGIMPRTANAAPAPRAAPATTSLGKWTPVYTRDNATDQAIGATARPQAGDSSATPVANAAADAACPDGNEVVIGWRFSCRPSGTGSSTGRGRRTDRLPRVLMVSEARLSEARPRAAARRPRGVRPAAMTAAVANHSTPWFALRLSRGRTGSAYGQFRSAANSNSRESRARSRSRRACRPGFGTVRSTSGLIQGWVP